MTGKDFIRINPMILTNGSVIPVYIQTLSTE